jgi:hypothetical protein
MNRLVTFALLLVVLASVFAAAQDYGEDDKKVTIDTEKIYFGSPAKFKKPGVINAKTVFLEIPAYQEIVREKLTKKDAKYMILIAEANKIFKKALKKVFDESGYDLVGEIDSIQIEGETVPEITSRVIEAIE